jgi:hypothetical protein
VKDIEYGDFNPSYNKNPFGVISQMVARRPRDFEMLFETDLRLDDDFDPGEVDWDNVEAKEQDLKVGGMNEYEADVYVDGERLGTYSESFIEADGEEVVEEYEKEQPSNYQKAFKASWYGNVPAASMFATAGVMDSFSSN